jgi:hypothetical protein
MDVAARIYALDLSTTQLISEYLRSVPDAGAQTKWARGHLHAAAEALPGAYPRRCRPAPWAAVRREPAMPPEPAPMANRSKLNFTTMLPFVEITLYRLDSARGVWATEVRRATSASRHSRLWLTRVHGQFAVKINRTDLRRLSYLSIWWTQHDPNLRPAD